MIILSSASFILSVFSSWKNGFSLWYWDAALGGGLELGTSSGVGQMTGLYTVPAAGGGTGTTAAAGVSAAFDVPVASESSAVSSSLDVAAESSGDDEATEQQ